MSTITKLAPNKFRVQARTAAFKKSAVVTSMVEARALGAAFDAQAKAAKSGAFVQPPRGTTLADAIDKYIQIAEAEKRSWGRTKSFALAVLKRDMGGVSLNELNAASVRHFIDKRMASGTTGGMALVGEISTLSAVLHWLKHARGFAVDPNIATDARKAMAQRGLQTRSRVRERLPAPGELDKMLNHWRGKSRQRMPMVDFVRFALASSFRAGEICGIDLADVDWEAKTVLIRDRKHPTQKIGNDQIVPLVNGAWEVLTEVAGDRRTGSLFPGLSPKTASTLFTRCANEMGINDGKQPNLSLHSLRHAGITALFARNLNIPEVAVVSGHRDWAMLKRYSKISAADVHRKLNRGPATN